MAAKKATVQVPTSLDEITLGQYQEFLKAQEDNQNEYFLQIKAIEIFCLVPEKDVKMIMAKDVKKISDKIINLFKGEHELVKSFKLNGIEYGFISSMDEMSFGEYVDLDTNISDWKTMFISMAVLYRPIAHRSSGRYEVEEYDAKTPDRALAFPMSAVLGSLFFFVQYRKRLIIDYPELFEGSGGETTSAVSQFGQKFGWYSSLYGLSGGDVLKIEAITKLNMHECLYMLTYMKEKNELEARQIKNKIK